MNRDIARLTVAILNNDCIFVCLLSISRSCLHSKRGAPRSEKSLKHVYVRNTSHMSSFVDFKVDCQLVQKKQDSTGMD